VTALLEVEGLTTTFPANGERLAVVEDVDLQLEAGEVLALWPWWRTWTSSSRPVRCSPSWGSPAAASP
jgi:hypothetical protein